MSHPVRRQTTMNILRRSHLALAPLAFGALVLLDPKPVPVAAEPAADSLAAEYSRDIRPLMARPMRPMPLGRPG